MEFCGVFMTVHQRITDRILDYWNTLRGEAPYASEDAIDWYALGDVREDAFLLRIIANDDFTFSYLGKNVQDAYGEDMTGEQASSFASPSGSALKEYVAELIKTGAPVTDEGEFVNKNGKVVRYRQCLVPLTSDGDVIEAVLGGMRFRLYDQ